MLLKRQNLEDREHQGLASYAVKSRESNGRNFNEKEDEYRLCFQRDKDRVVHSKAFRRLDEKTQVFMPGISDHYRTRLTHTLEVAQISSGIARRLGLNEDLAEVIALAHDLGHPPFGHTGEDALDEVLQGFGLHFEHNEQSRRIVEKLERINPKFEGLNLSIEVIEGMMKHQSAWDQVDREFELAAHLEAQVVNIGDEIAYTNHDVDDGLRSGLIKLEELDDFEIWRKTQERVREKYGEISDKDIFVSRTVSKMISMMIEDLCLQTEENIKELKIETVNDVRNSKVYVARFSDEMQSMLKDLRNFLYNNFYMSTTVLHDSLKGKEMIKELFKFYIDYPDHIPDDFKIIRDERIEMVVKDYIAGMTDRFLIEEYKRVVGD